MNEVTRTRQEWAVSINKNWEKAEAHAGKAVGYAIKAGQDLIKSKAQLPREEYKGMLRSDLRMGREKARRLITLARHPEIANPAPGGQLPAHWATLAELSDMSPQDFADARKKGLITEGMTRREGRAVKGAYSADKSRIVGDDSPVESLPTAIVARRIAKETGRLVAARDGNIYSGASEVEEKAASDIRNRTYFVLDVIKGVAEIGVTPTAWVKEANRPETEHRMDELNLGDLDDAINWLSALRSSLLKKKGIING